MTDHPRAEPLGDAVVIALDGETYHLTYWQALKLRDELHEAIGHIAALAWVI